MELRQLSYFIALYEEGSVTRAARRLNVVQPAVSMQINKLEDELGQMLFERMPKGMIPTSAGEEAYRFFLPVIQDLRTARDRVAGFGGRVAGHVSVGAIASVINNALTECLETFCGKYPDVSVRVTGGYTEDFLEMIQAGQLDVAVINQSQEQARTRHNLSTIPIMSEELALICAASTPLEQSGAMALASVAKLKLVIPSGRHGLRGIIDGVAAGASIRLTPLLEFDEIKTIEEFVQRTNFFTILPPIAVHRALRSGALRSFPLSPRITRNIVCVHSPRRSLSPATTLFIEEVRDSMVRASDIVGVSA